MVNTLGDVLLEIVDRFGPDIIGEDRRLRGIVLDLLSQDADSMRFIDIAMEFHLGSKILGLRDIPDDSYDIRLSQIKHGFTESRFLREGVADYITDSFLYALQWLDMPPAMPGLDENDDSNILVQFVEMGDGTSYCGDWKMKMRHGIGIERSDDGKCAYCGEWTMNRKKGMGVCVKAGGYRYAGEWKGGKPSGHGVIYLPGEMRICGQFDNGELLRGTAVCFMKDGSHMVGDISANGPDGDVLHLYPSGYSVEEKWENGHKI